MEIPTVAFLLDIIAAFIAWKFQMPLPGTGGEGGEMPAYLYAGAAISYGWIFLPIAYALTGKKRSK